MFQATKTGEEAKGPEDTTMSEASTAIDEGPLITCRGLTFSYNMGEEPVLRDINMDLKPGERCLLIGANGAGKSTLLRIFAGKHMVPFSLQHFSVLGSRVPQAQFAGLAYLGDFARRTVAFAASNVAYECDIPVGEMQKTLQEENSERAAKLVELLGINLKWRMHQVSDGQRRRVQIFLSLLKPPKVILMDEVTTSLDLVCKQDLLNFLKEESEQRGVSVLFATHILDGLDEWATHLMYLKRGGICEEGPQRLCDIDEWKKRMDQGEPNPLLRTIELRMRAERKMDAAREGIVEEAGYAVKKTKLDHTQGGYSSGRLAAFSASRFNSYR